MPHCWKSHATAHISCNLSWFNNDLVQDINSLLDSGDYSNLLMTFANSLDPDQARQNGFKLFDSMMVFLKKVNFCHAEYFIYYTPLHFLPRQPAAFQLQAYIFNQSGKQCGS